ncbi:MAG: 1-phosphofructokinase [Chloroflexi bacterium]|nr:1-phosphofructokinase [Chloroflexota bacterium]
MIITLTLNPAIDHTVVVDELAPGDTNRARESRTDIGGKGINVSRVLKVLGADSLAMGFVSGGLGRFIESTLNSLGIADDFIHTPGQTRTNITIVEKRREVTTTINEAGPLTDAHYMTLLFNRLKKRLHPGDWLVIGGSIPPPLSSTVYADIIEFAKSRGAITVLDADGEALARGIGASPFMVKPNRKELQRLLGRDPRKVETMVEAAEQIRSAGIHTVVISRGVEGAVAVDDSGGFQATPPLVQAVSAVGAGDSMVAGMVQVLSNGGDLGEALKLGAAAGTATALAPGTQLCLRSEVERLLAEVQVRQLRDLAAPRKSGGGRKSAAVIAEPGSVPP